MAPILIIDNNADAVLTLSTYLKVKGYTEVHVCSSGRSGLETAESLKSVIILLSISLYDLDGYTTCRLIRQQPWGKTLSILALTGYCQEEDRQRAMRAGFSSHMIKPVDLDILTKWLDRPLGT